MESVFGFRSRIICTPTFQILGRSFKPFWIFPVRSNLDGSPTDSGNNVNIVVSVTDLREGRVRTEERKGFLWDYFTEVWLEGKVTDEVSPEFDTVETKWKFIQGTVQDDPSFWWPHSKTTLESLGRRGLRPTGTPEEVEWRYCRHLHTLSTLGDPTTSVEHTRFKGLLSFSKEEKFYHEFKVVYGVFPKR